MRECFQPSPVTQDEVGAVYTDNSRELIATIGELG